MARKKSNKAKNPIKAWAVGWLILVGVLALATGIAGHWPDFVGAIHTKGQPLYKVMASISTSLFGFVMATIGIMSVLDTSRFTRVRISPLYESIWTTYMYTIAWLGFCLVMGVVGLLLLIADLTSEWWMVFHFASLWVAVVVVTCLARSVLVLFEIIKHKIADAVAERAKYIESEGYELEKPQHDAFSEADINAIRIAVAAGVAEGMARAKSSPGPES